ncbi:unnamed protein product [Caenorhabditis angaria]|uniref:Histone-lysine N-methyltransferase, H3 lysine-79 specific n=1 Tax=Caenorhabditis angaria TaxID=860376 RepID=A0A9P1I4A7_9PELO|nr:unnamed protein product [Caenorhabditis angaria]
MDSSIKTPSSTNSQNPSTSLTTPKSADSISVKVKPVIYKSSTLKLSISPNQQFLYGVILRIIKTVYASRIPQITSALPEDWEKIKENDVKRIGELISCYNKGAKAYNKIWDAVENRRMLGEWALPFCTQQIAAQITNWAYDCAVSTPSILNSHYKSFSSETYGETNLEQITSILNELQLGPDDVFVDLGSGVGHLVVYTAAFTKIKKAVGIELSSVPANHAQDLQHYYKKIMAHFGKSYSPFELHNGDFLDPKFRDLITKEATVIFINNYVFSPDLLVKISDELISELNDNVRIVTTKEMGVLKREVNDRTSRDISSILEMRQMKSVSNGVSWTANVVKFWLHTVDKSKVFKFFERKANRPKGKDSKSVSSSSSRESSQMKEKDPKRKEKEGSSDSSSSSAIKMEFSTPKEEKINLKRLAPVKDDQSINETTPRAKSEIKDEYDDDKYFFGRTTRRMWKAQVGGYSDNKKPDPAPSPKYTDAEYTPVTKKPKKQKELTEKKPKKEKPLSTPKHAKHSATVSTPQTVMKSPIQKTTPVLPPSIIPTISSNHKQLSSPIKDAKIDADTMNVINQLHEKTVTLTQQKHSVHDELARGELVCVPISQQKQSLQQSVSTSSSSSTQQQIAIPSPKVLSTIVPPIMVQPQPPNSQPIAASQVIPATPQSVNNVPAAMDLAADQRHTFMIPPTDPLYHFVVSTYLEFKNLINKAQVADAELVASLVKDIENEKNRNAELVENISSVNQQISEALGSKQIVAMHKNLTQKVANVEASCAQEEQKMREHGPIGEKTLELYDQMISNDEFCIQKISQQISIWKNGYDDSAPISAQPVSDPNVISPGQHVARRNKPRQRAGTSAKRIGSGPGKSEEQSEEVEREIQQFVQHALKVDSASKEKERRARGSGNGGNGEKVSRKGSTNPQVHVANLPPTVGQHLQQQKDASLLRSGPLIP